MKLPEKTEEGILSMRISRVETEISKILNYLKEVEMKVIGKPILVDTSTKEDVCNCETAMCHHTARDFNKDTPTPIEPKENIYGIDPKDISLYPGHKPNEPKDWIEEFDDEFRHLKTFGRFEGEVYFIKRFISNLLEKERESIVKEVEGMKKLHKHNSIPNYTDEVEEGCVVCLENKAITDVISLIKKI